MEINVSKLAAGASAVVAAIFVGVLMYFIYVLMFTGQDIEASPTLSSVNASTFGPKVSKVAASLVDASKKIYLSKKDILFTETPLYKSFTDIPEDVPLSDSRGRPDPFIPYVAP